MSMLDDAMHVARTLVSRGYSRSEAMPASTWRREGWSEDPGFFKLTDAEAHRHGGERGRQVTARFGDRFKLCIFDVDGVLLDGRSVHLRAFNDALRFYGLPGVTEAFHDEHLDSLSTRGKLQKLRQLLDTPLLEGEEPMYPVELDEKVDARKKELTEEAFSRLEQDDRLVRLFSWLRMQGAAIAVASNARQSSVEMVLDRLGLSQFVGHIATPTDGRLACKPATDLYVDCMEWAACPPSETLILEDSPVGLKGARATGATVLPVFHHLDVDIRLLRRFWQTGKTGTTVLIPMAGEGKRFKDAGYALPKPFVDVAGKPMIERVVESLGMPEAQHVFLARSEQRELYTHSALTGQLGKGPRALEVTSLTEGAACTTLLAEDLIDPDDRLVIANSDQLLEWDADRFLQRMSLAAADGGIATFRDPTRNPKWSYVETSITDESRVTRVVEKRAVSDRATCGVYFWNRARDYFESVRNMMDAGDRTNGEFYVAPSFNHLDDPDALILARDVKAMHGLGTPEDLQVYVASTATVEGPSE